MKNFSVFLLVFAQVLSASGAGFRNFGFEEADTSKVVSNPGGTDGGSGSTLDLLPGWQLTWGAVSLTEISYNKDPVDSDHATLFRGSQHRASFPIEGDFYFEFRLFNTQGPRQHFSLSQTAEIPIWADGFQFTFQGVSLSLEINGKPIPFRNTPPGVSFVPDVELFDISAYRGQTVELRLVDTLVDLQLGTGAAIDDLKFVTIPEPRTMALLGLGMAAAGLIRARRRRSHY